jgi:hypothetical protein
MGGEVSLLQPPKWSRSSRAGLRPDRRAASYFLIFMADPPRIRHSCEKSAISNENLQLCSLCPPPSDSH